MRCVLCKATIPREHQPQTIAVGNKRVLPPPLCDPCARANGYAPGSPEALERLVTGKLSEDEVARLQVWT